MTDFTEIGQRITDMTKMDMPSGILNKIKKLPELSKMTASFPKLESSGLVTEVTSTDASFDDLPIIKSWPNDAGRFITLGLIATKHPETGVRNLGVYRMQIIDKTHASMHWQKHKRGANHGDISKDQRRKNSNSNNFWRRTCNSFFINCTSSRRIRQISICRNYKKRRNQDSKM